MQTDQKLTYESGFVNHGIKVHGGWEHTNPLNPKMNDKIIKIEDVCIRCGATIDEDDGYTDMAGNDYCECCYDDQFVSWNDKLKETK